LFRRLFIASASPHCNSLDKDSDKILSQYAGDDIAESGGLGVVNNRSGGRVSFTPQYEEAAVPETTGEDIARSALRRLALAQVRSLKRISKEAFG